MLSVQQSVGVRCESLLLMITLQLVPEAAAPFLLSAALATAVLTHDAASGQKFPNSQRGGRVPSDLSVVCL